MTTTKTVTTQQELDAALASDADIIYINSPAGTWLRLSSSGSATVRAYGSATVEASGSATVRAYGSATVRAYDSATVEAYDSATVEAYDSATVRASGSATVEASGSATVRAYGSATVEASTHVAVHLHSARAVVTGGVLIDIAALDLRDPATWCGYHGVQVHDGTALLYKAVNASLAAGHQYYKATTYTIGSDVTADDWRDDHDCGGGLHISPRPDQAKRYRPDSETDTRYLRVAAALTDLRPIGDKAKARTVRVLAEVDAAGNDLDSTPRITEESAR